MANRKYIVIAKRLFLASTTLSHSSATRKIETALEEAWLDGASWAANQFGGDLFSLRDELKDEGIKLPSSGYLPSD